MVRAGYREASVERAVEVHICQDEEQSWDTLWKWLWFTREVWISEYWKETKKALSPVFSILPELHVRSILDCSCGLGFKTVMFAKMRYEVEGSDASAIAIKYAPKLAEEQGLRIRFFQSRYEELSKNCNRRYDCVYSDYFDEIGTRRTLRASARGIYSVLKDGGCFIFCGVPPELTKSDLKKLIEQEWRKRNRFEIDPPLEKDGLRVIHIEVDDKTSEGILENHIYLIEEGGLMRVEIASVMNPRIKWTFQDYAEALKEAGFREIESIERGETLIIAVK